MMGSYMLDKNMWDYKYTIRGKDGAASTITFSRTDGEPAWIKFCPNGNSTGDTFWQIRPSFGESGRPLVLRENLLPYRFETCISDLLKEINSL